MRTIGVSLCVVFWLSPGIANAQSVELYGSAGPTITDAGHSVAAGVGFSPQSRVTVAFNVERTHLSTRTSHHGDVFSVFRGGTLLLGSAEVRFVPRGRGRLGPYALAGFAAGISRPNVNDRFRDRITNNVRATFFGGGLQVPVSQRATIFADVRMMVGAEGIEGIVAVAPIRAGVSWRF